MPATAGAGATSRPPPIVEYERLGTRARAPLSYRSANKRTRRIKEGRRRRRQSRTGPRNRPISASKFRAACGATRRNSADLQHLRRVAIRLGLCPGQINSTSS